MKCTRNMPRKGGKVLLNRNNQRMNLKRNPKNQAHPQLLPKRRKQKKLKRGGIEKRSQSLKESQKLKDL